MPRRYREWPGLFRFDKVAEYGGAWRMSASWSVLARVLIFPSNTHASTTTVLGHFVESERTRPFPIPPRHDLRAPPDGNASRWPGCRCAISAQSRLHLKGISHLEIALRSRTRTQAI